MEYVFSPEESDKNKEQQTLFQVVVDNSPLKESRVTPEFMRFAESKGRIPLPEVD